MRIKSQVRCLLKRRLHRQKQKAPTHTKHSFRFYQAILNDIR